MIALRTGMKIFNAQQIFNTAFPFLKIEFLKPSLNANSGKARLQPILTGNASLTGILDKELAVIEDMTVALMEKHILDYFGLATQVFRKSGKLWLETSLIEDWTLEKQNEESKELSTEYFLRNGFKTNI